MSISPFTAKKPYNIKDCQAQETFCFMQRPLWVWCHGVRFMEKENILYVSVFTNWPWLWFCKCVFVSAHGLALGTLRSVDMKFLKERTWFVMWGHIWVAHREVINHPVIIHCTAVLSRILLWWLLCAVQLCSVFLNVSCLYALFFCNFIWAFCLNKLS